jgi:hypothetical protein
MLIAPSRPRRSAAPIAKLHLILITFMVMVCITPVAAQQNKCYPGLDCPGDIRGGDRRGGENPPPEPPRQRQQNRSPVQPEDEPELRQLNQHCSNPYAAWLGVMMGQPPNCTLPSTHCCFQNGSAVPLMAPLPFGTYCFTTVNMGGYFLPLEGLACRR